MRVRAKRVKAVGKAARRSAPNEQVTAAGQEWRTFTRKFLVAAALFFIPLSLAPESWYRPLNRLTALLSGELLQLLTTDVMVRGTYIRIHGFSVNVIAECSAIHLIALCSAFMLAFPATANQRKIGIGAGTSLLFVLNIIRIACVSMIGAWQPVVFNTAHIYFGQLVMIGAVIVICLGWLQWITKPMVLDGPMGFALRFFVFTSLPFLFWIPFNRIYVEAIDIIIQKIFALASYNLKIPHAHALYYQTFSIVVLGGLLWAFKEVAWRKKIRWTAIGFAVLTLFQIAFRMCNVWISAFNIGWMTFVAQVVYNACVYLLPPGIALFFFQRYRFAKAQT